MHLAYPAVLAVLLFSVGLYGVLARRNSVLVLMSVELMLNAVNLNLVAFDVWLRDTLHAGQALTLFTITIAAAEIGLGLAIVLMVFRTQGTADIDRLRALSDRPGSAESVAGQAGPAPEPPSASEPGSGPASGPAPASGAASGSDSQGKATVA
ncbi:NADH-quinone oxidoreductase subunit NuoK [Streptacidiphilus sp. N1-12]|uniref:NADH-quinone oxidoreductase subunit NuoK n=2 Tax=Streptacidiphilus alkalitolerans TaxID=3342712 RepID=A0ABV6WDF9_9ACTN